MEESNVQVGLFIEFINFNSMCIISLKNIDQYC